MLNKYPPKAYWLQVTAFDSNSAATANNLRCRFQPTGFTGAVNCLPGLSAFKEVPNSAQQRGCFRVQAGTNGDIDYDLISGDSDTLTVYVSVVRVET